MRKLGLIAAALLMACTFHFTFHSSLAADAAAVAEKDGAAVVCPCGNEACPWAQGQGQGRGPGFGHRGMGMRQGWHGRQMMHHQGGMMRPGMMRQGWRNWNNDDDRNDDRDDSRRGRRFGRGMGMQQQRFGGMGQGMRQGAGMGMMPRFMDELNLTDDQRKRMIDVATENFRERLTLRWEMEKARTALEDLNDAETPDYDAIIAANEALGAARGKMDVARRQVNDRFAAVLTAEQKAIIEDYLNEQDAQDDGAEEGDSNE